MERLIPVNGNYFKASEELEAKVLEDAKSCYYEMIEEYPEPLKNLMLEFLPWNYYEDVKGKNCFRVTGVDEVEVEEGKYCLFLHAFKAESSKVNELTCVNPKLLRKTDGWKAHQREIISQCKIPEAFLRPMGYMLLRHLANDAETIDDHLERVKEYEEEKKVEVVNETLKEEIKEEIKEEMKEEMKEEVVKETLKEEVEEETIKEIVNEIVDEIFNETLKEDVKEHIE
jgi:hypothetical protein